MADLKIAVMGASGRMGQALVRAIEETAGAALSGILALPYALSGSLAELIEVGDL